MNLVFIIFEKGGSTTIANYIRKTLDINDNSSSFKHPCHLHYSGGGRKINMDSLESLNNFATYGTTPDLTFFIDILPDEGARRQNSKQDRIEQAGIELQNRTRELYLKLAEKFSDRIVVINGQGSIDTIHKNIWKKFENRMLEK